MTTTRSPIWILALLLSALASAPNARAQEASPAESESAPDAGATDAGEGEDSAAGGADGDAADAGAELPPAEAASDAKRVVRIRRVIELDTQRLRWLRHELRSRTQWFEDLAAEMTEISEVRNEKREALEKLREDPEADADEIAELEAEVEVLTEDYALFDTQTDLALKAEKTLREQIKALEDKLAKEERALGELTGQIEIELPQPATAEPAAEPTPTEDKGAQLPMPVPLPSTVSQPAPEAAASSSAMTAAQLEAHKVLQRKQEDVELAKLALAEFIERKRALQRQIEFEKNLLETDAKERENLKAALEAFVIRLEKYKSEGAAKPKIERLERGIGQITRTIEDWTKSAGERSAYIESLLKRLSHLEEAELRVTEDVDLKRAAAEKAARQLKWLESPIHPQNVAHWAKERGPRMLLVVAAAIFLLFFVQFSARGIARAVVRRRRDERGAGTGRADTLAFSFRSVSRVLIVVFAALLVLQEAGIDIKTVLGGAAIIGVAIAFGAQDLMKDYFSGFLILVEDQYQLGDLVTIRGITGTVESVNMRVTVLRDLEGRVHFMPNGNIDHVTNRTYAWGRPVFEVPVDYDADVDRVMEVLVEVAKELRDDPDWQGAIIGEPEMLGVDKFTDKGVVIKFMVKTQPDKLFPVRRQMLRRIAKRFHELGIRITVPQRIIIRDEDGTEL